MGSKISRGRTLSTASRVLEALELIGEHQGVLNAKVLALRLGISLSTAYYLINTLKERGFIQSAKQHDSLDLGPQIPRLYQHYVATGPHVADLGPVLIEISNQAEARSYLAIWGARDVEIVEIHGRRGARELQGIARGFRGAAHALAVGKIFLAHLQPAQYTEYIQGTSLRGFTEHTINDPEQLQRQLARVREAGLAFDVEEYALEMCCIAAPVYDGEQQLTAALGISVPARRFHSETQDLIDLVRKFAHEASAQLGYRRELADGKRLLGVMSRD